MKHSLNEEITKLQCKLKECERDVTLTDSAVDAAVKVQQKTQQMKFMTTKNLQNKLFTRDYVRSVLDSL